MKTSVREAKRTSQTRRIFDPLNLSADVESCVKRDHDRDNGHSSLFERYSRAAPNFFDRHDRGHKCSSYPLTVLGHVSTLIACAVRFPWEIPSWIAGVDNTDPAIIRPCESGGSFHFGIQKLLRCNLLPVVTHHAHGAYPARPRISASHAGVLRLAPAAACRSLQVDVRGAA